MDTEVKQGSNSPCVGNSEFVTPTNPPRFQRSFIQNLSPGPCPSASRRAAYSVQPSAQRRRKQRPNDCCGGSCSSCGRNCRIPLSRWGRSSKNRIICSNLDGSTSRVRVGAGCCGASSSTLGSCLIGDRRKFVQYSCDETKSFLLTKKSLEV